MKKHWKVQTDGDLWAIAWNAIRKRGPESQTIRWVKGHAAQEDLLNGLTTEADRFGNEEGYKMLVLSKDEKKGLPRETVSTPRNKRS